MGAMKKHLYKIRKIKISLYSKTWPKGDLTKAETCPCRQISWSLLTLHTGFICYLFCIMQNLPNAETEMLISKKHLYTNVVSKISNFFKFSTDMNMKEIYRSQLWLSLIHI